MLQKRDTVESLREENRRLKAELDLERVRLAALACDRFPQGESESSAKVPPERTSGRDEPINERLLAAISAIVESRLAAALGGLPHISEDAARAYRSRLSGRARGFYFVDEFACVIGRHNQFVSDRCNDGRIRTLAGGKPYRIPLSEEDRWNALSAA